jgi:hypothetical protein
VTVAAPSPSRHRTGRRGGPGRPRFVKVARDPAHRAYLLWEAAVYDAVRSRCPATAARVPGEVRWDAEADELQMEALPAQDLGARVEAAGLLEPAVAAAVGRAVGEFHAEAGGAGGEVHPSVWLRGGVDVDRPGPAHLRRLSAGGLKLLEALQRSEPLRSRLAALAPPGGDELIHGDLRWENVLVAEGPAPRVWLVDWELGGAGEHAWDAACFAAAAVSAWLWSIPFVPGVPLHRLSAEAAIPIEALAPALNVFWSAYRASAPRSAADGWAERCAQLAAVRLVHLGFECTAEDLGLRPSAVAHLQVASHVLDDPARAGRDLLGLP